MALITESSLALTVDAVAQAIFFRTPLPVAERRKAADFIAARQGKQHCYAGLFAPLEGEPDDAFTLFTGESINSRAGARHILGEEAYRALLQLGETPGDVEQVIERAAATMGERLVSPDRRGAGMYCCGRCSVAVWRCLLAGGYGGIEGYVESGVEALHAQRDGKGRWRVFPFWYTLLALEELRGKAALCEMRYAAPLLERALKRPEGGDRYATRRRMLAERVLALC